MKINKAKLERLALAASQGPVQFAIAEARENSTAMLVIPAEPPGRNVCAAIRQMVTNRSKLIIVGQQGSLPAGGLERLLRASMPDCEKKLRVMDAGESLADAVNSAERNRHYRPGQVLEIFCDPELARQFALQMRSGDLKFDPTVITCHPQKTPSDDVEGIQSALVGNDPAALHRMLDPHIFSSAQGIADYKQGMKSESLSIGMVREFLRDIASTKQRGAERLAVIAKRNSELLRQRGIDLAGAEYLGMGNNGVAFQLSSGKVLKLTTDDAEAHVASAMRGKNLKHVFKIYDVWAFPGTFSRDAKSPGHQVYGLVTEEGLEKPTSDECHDFDQMVAYLEQCAEAADVNLEDDMRAVLQKMMASRMAPEQKRKLLDSVKKFDLIGMMSDMRKIGVQADLHSGNFMKRPDGTFVIIDIGTGGDQEDSKPPFLESDEDNGESFFQKEVPLLKAPNLHEFGSGSPGSGMDGPPQMRGSNSSAWASGRRAILDPRNQIPDDKNETEADIALDWGPGST